jgi:hypothetical protein
MQKAVRRDLQRLDHHLQGTVCDPAVVMEVTWMKWDDRGTDERRIGRIRPNAPPSIAATGRISNAWLDDASWFGGPSITPGLPAEDRGARPASGCSLAYCTHPSGTLRRSSGASGR